MAFSKLLDPISHRGRHHDNKLYVYEPLSYEDSIRVLVLNPGCGDDRVQCRLEEKRLSKHPHYEAVSYAWGDESTSYPIMIDGASWKIRENLLLGLRQFRHETQDRILWVDALCINQEDIPERNQQVRQMSLIYRSSKVTLVWLGPRLDADAAAITILNQIDDLNQTLTISEQQNAEATLKLFHQHKNIGQLGASMEAFIAKSWNSRVWVVQEFALSSNVEMWCGDSKIAPGAIGSLVTLSAGFHGSQVLGSISRVLLTCLHTLTHFISTRPLNLDLFTIVVFAASSTLKASDERDHIYGFLGLLAPNSNLVLQPNYALHPADVFREAMMVILDNVDELTKFWLLLGLAACCRPDTMELPTWVIYFPSDAGWRKSSLSRDSVFSTSKGLQGKYSPRLNYSFEDGRSVLRILGRIVDLVQTSCPSPYQFSTRFQNANHAETIEWYQHCKKIFNINISNYPNGESLQEVWWRMLVCDLYVTPGANMRAAEGFGSLYLNESVLQDAWRHGKLSDDVSEASRRYWLTLCVTSLFWNFCITAKQHAGYLHHASQEGDAICIFSGSPVPHVVRKLPSGNYQLIGEAYIHGIMDGEAMEWENIEWEDIRLE